jgi:ATP-dependent Zn protease
MDIITENKDILDSIAKTLIEKEKIDGKELLQLIAEIRPELVPKGAAEKVE